MKNYKIIRVSPMAHMLRSQLYLDHLELQNFSYKEQLKFIISGNYNYSGSFSREMNILGNKTYELIYNIEILQKQWAKENNVALEEGKHWQRKVVTEQLKKLQPDVVYIQGISTIDSTFIETIREKLPNLKLIVQYSGYPTGWERIEPKAMLLVGTPYMVKQAKNNGLDAHLVYHSFDSDILKQLNTENSHIYDFTFVGSSGYGYGDGHKTRYWDLLKLAYNSPLQLWLDERELLKQNCGDSPFEKVILKKEFTDNLKYKTNGYPTPPCKLSYILPEDKKHKSVHGLDYSQLLKDSKMTFHRHTDQAFGYAGAMRLFEATGLGVCLITDNQKKLSDIFEPDKEVVTYNSLSECVEKVNYLIEHPSEMENIARAGQNRTLTQHTTKHRCEQIHELILNRLNY